LLSTVVVMGAFSILASARTAQSSAAAAKAIMWNAAWMLIPPAIAIMPLRAPDPWNELVGLLKDLCRGVAPSSPLGVVLADGMWVGPLAGSVLRERLVVMVLMQCALATLAVLLAASSLRAREPFPSGADPYRGYRPRC